VYLTLDGWEDGGKSVSIGTIFNPLVTWIWVGGALLTVGGLLCLIPSRHATAVAAEKPVEKQTRGEPEVVAGGAHGPRKLRRRHEAIATGRSV